MTSAVFFKSTKRFGARPLNDPGACWSGWMGCPESPRDPSVPTSLVLGPWAHTATGVFYMGSENELRSSHLQSQPFRNGVLSPDHSYPCWSSSILKCHGGKSAEGLGNSLGWASNTQWLNQDGSALLLPTLLRCHRQWEAQTTARMFVL